MGIFDFLRSDKLDVEKLMKHIGQRDFYIMNGYGYSDVNKPEIFDNRRIEVAIGRTTSGHGDWGGGFDRMTTCPISIIIDEHFNIIEIKYDDFYNSDYSKEVRWKCEKWVGKKKFKTLKVRETSNLYKEITGVIARLGIKEHIRVDRKYDAGKK
jgi:hypothetical protein